jgi:hypothetical protein
MKNQKKNSAKKVISNEAKWLTPQEAAKKLGLTYNEENTLQHRLAKNNKNALN